MSISLILISNVRHKQAELSLNKSIKALKFDDVLVFSDQRLSINSDYRYYQLPKGFDRSNYSAFCMKGMDQYIQTDHCLIIQPDGMAINSQYWTDEFLEYDYIGSPCNIAEPVVNDALSNIFGFSKYKDRKGWYVGNGGFSLRSKKLLKALQDPRIKEYVVNESTKEIYFGEDLQICVLYKTLLESEYGIKFAPVDLAVQFSTERLCDNGMSFGFHGWQNIPWFLSEEECIGYLNELPINWDSYRLNRLSGFLFEKRYFHAMQRLNELRNEWQSF
ncbi:hypothetical protein UFOVP49_217 [uncultured Caudovirales phage]|uniref:DUF5672 domain-containing protein n=1 Tax=uncultured Caudovirales phage TaxID=2100421 RepID=A0A6J5KWM8_9CAUD|nr:hypothetical protein UFOVP49_217 [uncultured Caudovirales phage]